MLRRIIALAVPPAWNAVWICPDHDGHIQALGYDERGRRQYRYHAKFRVIRDGAKFEHIMSVAAVLPRLREHIARAMAEPGLGRPKVLATVVHLLETAMIRVGTEPMQRKITATG
jgi:DNA topoisomerase-1